MRAIRINSKSLGVTLGVLACAVLPHISYARVVEGFESGDPAVTATGDASNQGAFQGEAAPQGTQQFLITTINSAKDGEGLSPVSGNNAVPNSTLQTFFNNISLLGNRGSGVLIPFTVLAGDTTMTLQYDFLSNEPAQSTPRNDFGFEAIFNSGNSVVQSNLNFVQVTGTSFSLFGSGSPFIFHTGYLTLSLNVASLAPGNYRLGIGV